MIAARFGLFCAVLAAGAIALGAAPAGAASPPPSPAGCAVGGAVSSTPSVQCGGAASDLGLASDGGLGGGGGGALLGAQNQLLTGGLGGAASALLGGGADGLIGGGAGGLTGGGPGGLIGAGAGSPFGGGPGGLIGAGAGSLVSAGTSLGLAAIGSVVVGAAAAVLRQAAGEVGTTTAPQLQSAWFSSTYWRMAAIATLLTLPFLFAATVQAALQSDVMVLARAALGYLPLAMLSIAIAAPLTSLLLAASDQLCGLISAAAGNGGAHVLAYASALFGGLTAFAQSPFLGLLVGLFAIAAAFAVWIELLLREASVYVVVLMLPLAFAALAWPARRVWALRGVEILVALILSKFAIVAVLSLGGAAISASIGHAGVSGLMAGSVLIMLAAVSPWALLRFVPLAEMAAGAAGALRADLRQTTASADRAFGYARSGAEAIINKTEEMRRAATSHPTDPVEPPLPGSTAAGDGDASPAGTAASTASPDEPPPAATQDEPAATATPGESPIDAPEQPQAIAPPEQPAASTTPQAPPPPEPDTKTRREPRWSERPTLELGPGYAGTPVWPHPDAE